MNFLTAPETQTIMEKPIEMPNFETVDRAFTEFRALSNTLDSRAGEMATLLVGRLRRCKSVSALKALKRELRDFNIHTEVWK